MYTFEDNVERNRKSGKFGTSRKHVMEYFKKKVLYSVKSC